MNFYRLNTSFIHGTIPNKNFKSLHERILKILLTCSRLVNIKIRDITMIFLFRGSSNVFAVSTNDAHLERGALFATLLHESLNRLHCKLIWTRLLEMLPNVEPGHETSRQGVKRDKSSYIEYVAHISISRCICSMRYRYAYSPSSLEERMMDQSLYGFHRY